MKQYIVANWKSNKTEVQATDWLAKFSIFNFQFSIDKEVIVCPPFTLLSAMESGIRNQELGIKLGAQNISPFDDGAYTGEISGKQIKEFAEYVIIGHSERRKYFNETDQVISQKVEQAINNQLIPIICVSSLTQISKLKSHLPAVATALQAGNYSSKLKSLGKTMIVAYEPFFAIGTGMPDTPEDANNMAIKIKEILDAPVLYGGSVTAENIASFTKMPNINGLLVGKASLNPQEFTSLISNA